MLVMSTISAHSSCRQKKYQYLSVKSFKVCGCHSCFVTVQNNGVILITFFRLNQGVGKISRPAVKNASEIPWNEISANS